MHATNTKDSILTINHWNLLLQFAGVVLCCGGVLGFLGGASIVQLWKPSTIVEVIKGSIALLFVFGLPSIFVLVGLRLVCGPDGVKIDVNQKTVFVWRRTLFLNKKQRIFKFEQLKQIKIAMRKKSGKFGPDFNVVCVIAGDEPNEVELDYFLRISEAKTLATRVAEFSGLQFLE
jgi:hypothetical protein